MNSGPVLYFIYFIFATKKTSFYCCSDISASGGTRKRAADIVYPDMLATKWDDVVRTHV